MVGPAGHGRRRRAHAVADPADEVHEGTAIQRRVVDHVEGVRPSRAARAEIGQLGQPRGVLRGGVQVATHERRVVDVRAVDHVRVGKGGVAPPVLRRGVDEDQLRRFAVGGDPLEETVAAGGARVVLRGVGEGEPVPEARRRLHGRLRTAMVELAAAAAAHQAQRAVDGPRAGLVDVEAEVQQMPDEAARLGHARQQHPIHRAVQRIVGPVRSHEGGEVAHGQQAGTGHRAARRPVHQVVDPPGADPSLDPQMTRVAAHLVTRRQREPPAITRHQRRRRMEPVAHVQPRLGVVHVDGRYRFVVADRTDVLIGQRHRRDVVGQLDPQLHPDGGGLAVGAEHQRCVEPHAVLSPRHVPLPPAPHQREAVTHEEPVPDGNPPLGRHVGHGPVEQARHHPPAAVRYVDEGDPVPTGRHHRPQHDDVAAEADPAFTVAGGLGQVDDVRHWPRRRDRRRSAPPRRSARRGRRRRTRRRPRTARVERSPDEPDPRCAPPTAAS